MIVHRDKKGGIVAGTIFGVGGLIIGVIVVLIITSTVGNAGLISNDQANTFAVTNESITLTGTGIAVLSPYTATSKYWTSWNASRVMNGSSKAGTNETLVEGTDYQIFSANGSIGNKTITTGIRVTYTYTRTETSAKDVVTDMRGNLSSGINNVSSKIPTILLIVAVVFLFGALVLLLRQAGLLGIGGGNSGGSL